MQAIYKWVDNYSRQVRSCICEVLGFGNTGKTVTIVLKGFGPKGRPPGTQMRVKPESVGIKRVQEPSVHETPDWHRWTD